MRKAWLAPVVIVLGIVLQLTVLNGLRLPGGGVPDLVLVLVCALAMAEGPLAGLIIGFAAGLCLDVAPPGSALIGQYALVFCLAGWAAGRLSSAAGRSALRSVVLLGGVVAAAEVLAAALARVLEPAQVTFAEVRDVLPATIGYDLVLCPFVLYLVMLASALLTDGLTAGLTGGRLSSLLAAPTRVQRSDARKRARLLSPRLGGSPRVPAGTRDQHRPRQTGARRPGAGVAGSASGFARHPGRPVSPPPNLRLGGGRRGDAAIGGAGSSRHPRYQPGRHPGGLPASGRGFRPRAGESGGSAARQHPPAAPASRGQSKIKFGGSQSRGGSAGPRIRTGASRGQSKIKFGGSQSRGGSAGPRIRTGASRSAAGVPRVDFRTAAVPVARRPAAVPRFRRRSSPLHLSAPASGLVGGGALGTSPVHASRRLRGTPRLKLARRRRASGTLGGSASSALRRPVIRTGKQPRFGYGRRSVLSFLTGRRIGGRRIGGRWLARQRVGSRSGVWLIGKRTGGLR